MLTPYLGYWFFYLLHLDIENLKRHLFFKYVKASLHNQNVIGIIFHMSSIHSMTYSYLIGKQVYYELFIPCQYECFLILADWQGKYPVYLFYLLADTAAKYNFFMCWQIIHLRRQLYYLKACKDEEIWGPCATVPSAVMQVQQPSHLISLFAGTWGQEKSYESGTRRAITWG